MPPSMPPGPSQNYIGTAARSKAIRRNLLAPACHLTIRVIAAFREPEGGLHHQNAIFPIVSMPEGHAPEVEVRHRLASQMPENTRAQFLALRPIELGAVEGRQWGEASSSDPIAHTWFRAVAPLPDDQRMHRAVLAFASDMTLLETCLLPHGLSWTRGEITSASLNYAIWFYEPFHVDDWLLYATDSPFSGGGRGFNGAISSAVMVA